MRDHDRFWWVRLIFGLACCVASIALPWHFLSLLAPDGSYLTAADSSQNLAMETVLGLLCLSLGILIINRAAQERARHRKRLAAFHGDLASMPLATIQPDPSEAPDVATQPLEVMWRANRGQSAIYMISLALSILGGLVSIGALLIVLIGPLIMLPQPVEQYLFIQTPPAPMSLNEIVLRIILACGMIALAVGGGVWLARILPGRPFGVRATPEGIEGCIEFGSRVHIAWREVILFEVSGVSGYATFALYAPRKCVTWGEYWTGNGSQYAPAGATESEMALRQAALLNLVTARTGLEPRTLAESLRRDFIGVPASAPQAGAFVFAILALLMAGLAIGEYRFPITPYAWANWPSVGALALLAIFLLSLAIMTPIRRRHVAALVRSPAAVAPSLDLPGIVYSLNWRVPPLRRAGFVGAGLLLVVNLIPAAIAAPQTFTGDLPGANGPGQFWGACLATLLGMAGLAGAYFTLLGGRSIPISIRADVSGLTRGSGPNAKLIPWANVREVIWNPRGPGGYPSYAMLTDNPLEAITWPTAPRYLDPSAPPDSAIPTSPAELAALIAAKLGAPIHVIG